MGIISWIIFGVVAGAIAKFIMPGRMEKGFVMTSLLGIVGACVGGFIGTSLGFGKVTGFNLPSFFVAVLGAMVVLILYGKLKSR
ncbi:GlsB/YeaQ/YmgE family stress response membrane protein [Desulfovibrio sp.]|uniref:GlsB/YeaQ/YmgE family stress response membrane protein n=1 Tax=Desulfovibrio sp. TaxID=885 RepID=UPI0025BB932F|nr:GlsB/YeaQ/YmgE family stress response membrane protein [Desulfovibrio sp.]